MSETTFTCPFCPEQGIGPDPTRNLNVQVETGLYHCWRCGAKLSVTGPLPEEYRGHGFGVVDYDRGQALAEELSRVQQKHSPLTCDVCFDFLERREILLPGFCNPAWLYGGWYEGHRLFFEDRETGYWQGRALSDRSRFRYTSPRGLKLEQAPILDMYLGPHPGYVPVIVEGPTDGLRLWSAGIRAICLYGKSYSPKKLERLQTMLRSPRRVILCLDRDGCEIEAAHWTYEISKFTAVEQWPIVAADPGEMLADEITALRARVRHG